MNGFFHIYFPETAKKSEMWNPINATSHVDFNSVLFTILDMVHAPRGAPEMLSFPTELELEVGFQSMLCKIY